MSISKELIKGSTKTLILSALKEGELYGYQITKIIKTKSKDAFKMGEGTLYPALHSLEKDKYLSSRWEESDDGRKRKYYSLTAKGKDYLKESLEELKEFNEALNNTLFSY